MSLFINFARTSRLRCRGLQLKSACAKLSELRQSFPNIRYAFPSRQYAILALILSTSLQESRWSKADRDTEIWAILLRSVLARVWGNPLVSEPGVMPLMKFLQTASRELTSRPATKSWKYETSLVYFGLSVSQDFVFVRALTDLSVCMLDDSEAYEILALPSGLCAISACLSTTVSSVLSGELESQPLTMYVVPALRKQPDSITRTASSSTHNLCRRDSTSFAASASAIGSGISRSKLFQLSISMSITLQEDIELIDIVVPVSWWCRKARKSYYYLKPSLTPILISLLSFKNTRHSCEARQAYKGHYLGRSPCLSLWKPSSWSLCVNQQSSYTFVVSSRSIDPKTSPGSASLSDRKLLFFFVLFLRSQVISLWDTMWDKKGGSSWTPTIVPQLKFVLMAYRSDEKQVPEMETRDYEDNARIQRDLCHFLAHCMLAFFQILRSCSMPALLERWDLKLSLIDEHEGIGEKQVSGAYVEQSITP